VPPHRWSQILAWGIVSLFVLGFFFPLVGAWTGAILGVWFVGTQKPWRGFLWLSALTLLLSLVSDWRKIPLTGVTHVLEYLGCMVLVTLLSVLPFLYHRLVSPRLPGFLSTLPLPLAGAVLKWLALAWLPASIFSAYSLIEGQKANTPLLHIGAVLGIGAVAFLVYWFAAVVLWMWNEEFRASKIAVGASVFAAFCVLAAGFGLFRQLTGAVLPAALPNPAAFAWICLGGVLALSIWALFHPGKCRIPWADRPEIALLQSPSTRTPLELVRKDGRETLISPSGERFPIRDAIPVFLKPDELAGSNRKYRRLYETIGGFYDDAQRVVYALRGVDQDAHFLSYLPLLEIKPGDLVLETSVGTGLNFKYLPRGIKLFGLDISPEMLARCQANLRRWQLDADLFLGNAERLPFADCSFDVVFHVGGINFFSDRAEAIQEMIRVAKPGSRVLIADETEEHVKETYEHMPIASGYFKDRREAVAAPIDLVPPQMQEIHLESLLNDRFYALTFRKPAHGA
jgi:ubiquinone/menaquinone biosynthesis C-methylase UbiE